MFSSFIEHACKYVKIKSLLLCLGAIEVRLYSMFKNEMYRNKFSGLHSKLVLSPSKFIVHACKYKMFSIPPSCSIKQAFEYKWIWNNINGTIAWKPYFEDVLQMIRVLKRRFSYFNVSNIAYIRNIQLLFKRAFNVLYVHAKLCSLVSYI